MSRLAFEHLTMRFGAQAVFEDFSLELPVGRISCLMGPTGCGKTTLLRLMMGLAKPDTGRVLTLKPVSAVFQEDRLLEPLSALANLRLVTGPGKEKTLQAMLDSLGLEGEAAKPVRDFSGGMKRRVAIARALLAEYELLLLDEPFKGLDKQAREQAASVILRHAEQKTVVLVTHDPLEAALLGSRIYKIKPDSLL